MSPKEFKDIKILNVAWVGQGDFGDEVMAFILRKFFQQEGARALTYYQQGRFTVYRSANDLVISHLHHFNVWSGYQRLVDWFWLPKFDVIVIGGGSIFQSHSGIAWKLALVKRLRNNRERKVFIAAVGISFGPIKSKAEETMIRELLSHLDCVIVRDQNSFTLAQRLRPRPNLYASFDTSLLMAQYLFKEYLSTVQREPDLVGISFIQKKDRQGRLSYDINQYLQIINHLLNRGKRVILFNLYRGAEYLDGQLVAQLKAAAKNPANVSCHDFDGDIFRTIKLLNRCSHILSMRLHGAIFAYLFSIPFICLGYHQKNLDFCQSIGYPLKYYFDFCNPVDTSSLLETIDEFLAQKVIDPGVVVPPAKAIQVVQDNFVKLANLLYAS